MVKTVREQLLESICICEAAGILSKILASHPDTDAFLRSAYYVNLPSAVIVFYNSGLRGDYRPQDVVYPNYMELFSLPGEQMRSLISMVPNELRPTTDADFKRLVNKAQTVIVMDQSGEIKEYK